MLAVAFTACEFTATPREQLLDRRADPSTSRESDRGDITFYVTRSEGHSGIVLSRATLPAGYISEAADFPTSSYLSFGWGDADYYPAPEPTLGMTLRAVFLPTRAVMHLAGLSAHPRELFPEIEVVALRASRRRFRKLVAYLDRSFDREGARRAKPVAPGQLTFSLFYKAVGDFHLFNTCNTWTARALEEAGWPIKVIGTITADDLMEQVRALSRSRKWGHSTF